MIRTPYAVLTVLRVRQKWKLFVNKIKKARIVSGSAIQQCIKLFLLHSEWDIPITSKLNN